MLRMMMNSKLHRATVTEADLNYIGSITIDSDLLDAAGMLPNEKVHVVNNNNGERFETYIIAGQSGSGVICVNGAAARLVQKGDIVIILSYVYMSNEETQIHEPTVLIMDESNKILQTITETPFTTVI
ncbi:aspartate 1-decarboxylase [Sporosarcina siberiensis]|uniref:Aspartate 1-decarboxylase n=1 Tax=Sporosarcina siberiensis TaxID=1365606 RepID=A0ABW4SFN7_9BACL